LPPVAKVFQRAPHPPKNGSGVPSLWHDQTLDAVGDQSQSGHRMRLNPSSSSAFDVVSGVKVGVGPFL